MLNFCYLYAIEWLLIMGLYLLKLTDFGEPLCVYIVFLILFSSCVSFMLGYVFRKKFKFVKIAKFPRRNLFVTVVIIISAFAEYYYYGDIPLLGILAGRMQHAEFSGIKTFHVFLCTFTSFYLQYIFYLFICFPKRRTLLLEYAIVLFCTFCLQYNRGWVLITLIGSALMLIALLIEEHKIKKQHVLYMIVFGIASLYLFGCFGNLRVGAAWDDSSYICSLSKVNSRYPAWLPKQFVWPYIYITGSVANLNFNVLNNTADVNIAMFFVNFLPDFITRRAIPSYYSYNPKLIAQWHTTYTGFGNAYITGGIVGMYLFYLMIILGNLFMLLCFKPKKQFLMPYLTIMCTIVLFMFFTNTIAYSAISFPIVYPILSKFVLYKHDDVAHGKIVSLKDYKRSK